MCNFSAECMNSAPADDYFLSDQWRYDLIERFGNARSRNIVMPSRSLEIMPRGSDNIKM